MLKRIKNILYIGSFFVFIILTIKFYFSDQNIRETNKSRSFYSIELNNNMQNLPLLKNDTNNIIVKINEIYTKKLENEILKHPEQYFWFHRKWDKSLYV